MDIISPGRRFGSHMTWFNFTSTHLHQYSIADISNRQDKTSCNGMAASSDIDDDRSNARLKAQKWTSHLMQTRRCRQVKSYVLEFEGKRNREACEYEYISFSEELKNYRGISIVLEMLLKSKHTYIHTLIYIYMYMYTHVYIHVYVYF